MVFDAFNNSNFGVIEDNCELGMDHLDFDLGLGFGLIIQANGKESEYS